MVSGKTLCCLSNIVSSTSRHNLRGCARLDNNLRGHCNNKLPLLCLGEHQDNVTGSEVRPDLCTCVLRLQMVTITIVVVNDRIFSNTGFMQTLQAAMKDADVTTEQLDWLVLHQANQRILDAAAQRIGISSERVVSNLAEYGNTSAASIPLAFDEAVRGGKIKSGDTVGMSAPDSTWA